MQCPQQMMIVEYFVKSDIRYNTGFGPKTIILLVQQNGRAIEPIAPPPPYLPHTFSTIIIVRCNHQMTHYPKLSHPLAGWSAGSLLRVLPYSSPDRSAM
ncbi:hypothetical protein Tco_0462283 [Tanacetum coccineum]